jgi:hypothetical protein
MVVEPEERLFLALVSAGGIVQIQVVDPLFGPIRGGPPVRVAIALRRRVPVVQVREERPLRVAEVAAIEAQRVGVELVFEADQGWLPILCIDHRPREGAVEPVDGAAGQVARTGDAVGGESAARCCRSAARPSS